MMYHIPDVLSTDQVAEFTRQLAQAEWVDGRVTVGSQGRAVKQNQQIDTRTPLYARLQAAVLDMLRGHPQFFSAALPRTISAPLFKPLWARGDLWFSRRWRRSPERRGGLDAH
ncbi:PKHD-type hydroxylase Sbal_3634 [Serratia liquefaciens]|nr:PKHD-type hydroxylase Sbal_3634 [Serratia liquefaciens]